MSERKAQKSRVPVTYEAIAARAQVSKTTVSLVLRGLARERIPSATYARVEAAARELGYYPNRLVQAIREGRTETLAVIAPALWLEHAGRILDGIREEAARHGYSILLGSASENAEDERASAERLLQQRADGLIRFSAVPDAGRPPTWLVEAFERGVPCVVIDDVALQGQVDCVVSDDTEGAYHAVRYLLDQGHRRIAHIRGDLGRTSAEERAQGYRRAIADAHAPYERVCGHSYLEEGLFGLLADLFGEADPPTALFACNDGIAAHAQAWLRDRGRRVPDDVAIIGFSGTIIASEAEVTTVEQPFHAMGVKAVQRLLARIGGDPNPFRVDRIPTRLLVRASTERGLER